MFTWFLIAQVNCLTKQRRNMKRKLIALIAALSFAAILSAVPSVPADAHHSGSCNISSPKVNATWGCGKHSRTSSTFGYVQLDDTHTNGRGLYAYAVYSGDSNKPSDWSLMALWGGDKKTFWVSRSFPIIWVAYCDGAKNAWGTNCILKGW